MTTDLAVQTRGLRKSYGTVEAVRGVDLTVRRGEVFGLIGPNGAGKTTTLEILEGHRETDDGEVRVLGFDPAQNEREFKERIGIVLQTTSMPMYLRVEEVIDMFRGYYPHPRPLDEVLELVGLTDVRRKLIRRLSGGQQRRLDVGIGLAGDPELLFLDEPTTGFDPEARRAAWGMIRQLKALGKTIVLTTHYMEEAQALADRVAFIHDGRIVAEGTPDELRGQYDDVRISFRLPEGHELPPEVARLCDPGGTTRQAESLTPGVVDGSDGHLTIHTSTPTQTLHQLTAWATQQGIELEDLSVAAASLEDVYLRLSGERGS